MKTIVNRSSCFSQISAVLTPFLPLHSRVALFDFPNHSNVGDSAIWLGVEEYCRRNHLRVIHVDDCYGDESSLPSLPEDVIVLINGGGNLGDLYPRHQRIRERLLSIYKRNRVVQLPQSIQFDRNENADACARIFNEHPDFHLVVRDRESLEKAGRLYAGPVHLCPDMALCLTELPAIAPTLDTVALIRDDKEGLFRKEAVQVGLPVFDWLDEPALLGRAVGWITRKGRAGRAPAGRLREKVYHFAAHTRLRRGCRLLSRGRVVVTDRLHAHILCTMLEIPHVVLDNSYGKISSFRKEWNTGGGGLCNVARSVEEAVSLASDLRAMKAEAVR